MDNKHYASHYTRSTVRVEKRKQQEMARIRDKTTSYTRITEERLHEEMTGTQKRKKTTKEQSS